jgi:hypothetical protein
MGFVCKGTIPKEFGQLKKLNGHFCLQYNELKGNNLFSAFGFTFNFNFEAQVLCLDFGFKVLSRWSLGSYAS